MSPFASFEFFTHCDVLFIRLVRKNSAQREIISFFLRNLPYVVDCEIYPSYKIAK